MPIAVPTTATNAAAGSRVGSVLTAAGIRLPDERIASVRVFVRRGGRSRDLETALIRGRENITRPQRYVVVLNENAEFGVDEQTAARVCSLVEA